ncbi:MAG: hypothetical protein H6683_09675 [Deltaproteobacteria bacterium]|nr:hypothetical protein [Deltaproteobacteria bacterium]
MAVEEQDERPWWPYVAIGGMLALALATHFAWLDRVRYPFGAFHLSWSIGYQHIFREQGLIGVLKAWAGEDYYPPLSVSIWGILHHYFGASSKSIPIGNTLLFIPGLLALYDLCWRTTPKVWVGLCACALALVFPHAAFYFRVPLYEIPMGAALVVLIWGMAANERFTRALPMLAASVAFFAGMMMKWTFVAYAVVPLAYFTIDAFVAGWQRWRNGAGPIVTWRQLSVALLGVAVAVAMTAPWYLYAMDPRVFGDAGADPSGGALGEKLIWYLRQLNVHNLTPVTTKALCLCLPWAFFTANRRVSMSVALCALWSYFAFSFIPHRETRYMDALLPLFAYLIPVGLATAGDLLGRFGKWAAAAVGIVLCVATAWTSYAMSFREDVLPLDSGDLRHEDLRCLNDFDAVFTAVTKAAEQYPDGAEVRVATHPLSPMTLSYHVDLLYIRTIQYNADHSRKLQAIGFEPKEYLAYPERMAEADLLLVPEEIWETTPSDLEEVMVNWANTNTPGVPPPPVPAEDPLYRERIAAMFDPIDTMQTECTGPVALYKRKPEIAGTATTRESAPKAVSPTS